VRHVGSNASDRGEPLSCRDLSRHLVGAVPALGKPPSGVIQGHLELALAVAVKIVSSAISHAWSAVSMRATCRDHVVVSKNRGDDANAPTSRR
jgi:hypothetical protein